MPSMKCITTIFLLLSFVLTLKGQDASENSASGINWMSWDEAMDARSELPKKIFIDIYTDWCGWCKKMDATTFADPAVVEYMNKHYYSVKLDAEMKDTIIYNNHTFVNPQPGKRRSTHTLAASLLDSRLSYPSYVVFDENMNRIHLIPGYKQVDALMGILMFFGTNSHINYNKYYHQTVITQDKQGN